MLGNMMMQPLTIGSLIDHAARYHGDTEIVSVETDQNVARSCWRKVGARAKRLASALEKAGIARGDRCATIAWNNQRHLEIYFAVSGSGRVCHTINPRLFPEQITFIINHAQDRVLFVDKSFLPLVAGMRSQLPSVERIILMGPRSADAERALPELEFYDEVLKDGTPDYDWPLLDENTASSLCYTSGTTGDPKGVLYSHRSTVLHSLAIALPDSLDLSATETVLPVVPMFHVNAWGVPYAAAMVGARLVLPGPGLDGDSLLDLITQENVTLALGVPTIWQMLLAAAERRDARLDCLRRTVVGGSPCPPSMIDSFRDLHGVETIHAWGMTETSPVGTVNQPLGKHQDLPRDAQRALRTSQGRPLYGVSLRITDDAGTPLPEDGTSIGNLQINGHWIVSRYYRADSPAEDCNGWFETGDVSSIDPDGYMTIRDRSKDIIKSGGEWISSVELEGIAHAHPAVADAAVIGARHPKWDERPVLIVVPSDGQAGREEEILSFFEGKIAKWQVPDAVLFTDEIPRNSTGKIMKLKLREAFSDVLISSDFQTKQH